MANELKIKLSGHATQGGGYLDWERLEKRLKESGELHEQHKLKTLQIDKDGIKFTTRKKTKNEK